MCSGMPNFNTAAIYKKKPAAVLSAAVLSVLAKKISFNSVHQLFWRHLPVQVYALYKCTPIPHVNFTASREETLSVFKWPSEKKHLLLIPFNTDQTKRRGKNNNNNKKI